MHQGRVAPELPHREPVELRRPQITLLVLASAVLLLGCLLGCAGPHASFLGPVGLGPPGHPHTDSEEPIAVGEAEPGTENPGAVRPWVTLSRFGRESMRPGQYEQAERHFLAALEALDTRSPGDARIRATLGQLVRLAAIYQRLEREEDAQRVLSAIGDHVDTGGSARLRRGVLYDSRYRDLVSQPLSLAFSGVPVRSGVSRADLDALIVRTARSYRVDPALVKAVVAAESNFEPLAVSKAGAQGLMQLMPETAEELGVLAPFRPTDNLQGGVRYLRKLLDRYPDIDHALAAYNAGPTAVDRHGGIPPYPETREYVKRVKNFYRGYQGQLTR
jgi:soluble lytic murein transglycosylase-like protein